MDDALKAMGMDDLQAKCGKPASEASDGISRSLIYTPDSGTPIAFRFATPVTHSFWTAPRARKRMRPMIR